MREVLAELLEERTRSVAKHSWDKWAKMTQDEMILAVLGEVIEVRKAMKRKDYHGEHGIRRETIQAANVLLRIAEEMGRRYE